jgi:hypothetical protein
LSSSRGEVVEFTGKPMIETGGNRRRAGVRKSRGRHRAQAQAQRCGMV